MSEHEISNQPKSEEGQQKRDSHQQETGPQFESFHSWEDGIVTDAPFHPQMDRHAVLLSGARSDERRANLVSHLQRTYGNTYVQRLLGSMAEQTKPSVSPTDDSYQTKAERVADRMAAATRSSAVELQPTSENEEEQLRKKSLRGRMYTGDASVKDLNTLGRRLVDKEGNVAGDKSRIPDEPKLVRRPMAILDMNARAAMKNAWKESYPYLENSSALRNSKLDSSSSQEQATSGDRDGQVGPEQAILDSGARGTMGNAWEESNPYPGDINKRHEEGGWITNAGGYDVERWSPGTRQRCFPPSKPTDRGIVAAFHTHPNPETDEEGNIYTLYPGPNDEIWTREQNFSEESYVIGLQNVFFIRPDGSWDYLGGRESVLG